MTAAVYNQDGRWGIPAYIWPVVLGSSAAIHLSILIYGLPDMSWLAADVPLQPETEVVIEGGGLAFERVSAVETVPTQNAVPEAVPSVAPVETPVPIEPQASAVPARPAQSETLEQVKPDAAQIEASRPTVVEETQTVSATSVKAAEEIKSAPPVALEATPENQIIAAVEPSAATNQASTPAASPGVTARPAQSTPVSRPPASDAMAVVAVTPVTPLVPISDTKVQGIEAPPVSAQVVQAPANDKAATGPSIEPVAAAPVQADRITSSPAPAVSLSGNAIAVAAAKPVSTDAASPVAGSPEKVTASSVEQGEAVPVVRPGIGAGVVQAVKPLEQQVAALRPADEQPSAVAPARPDTSQITATPQASDPAASVAPVEVASIDPMARVTSYVANYELGDCAHLTVMSAGTESAMVTAYGVGIGPFAMFDQRFTADHGFEADVELRLVTQQQCALLNALGLSEGFEAAGLVELDRTVVRSGTNVSGLVQRDLPLDRIAAAEAAGVELNGRGPPELYLIDDGGRIHDGRDYILPESHAVAAGSWRFSVPVTLLSEAESETALVLAIWNRPETRQPASFGTLPAERIASVLAEPGVYSLSAFKVSR